MMSLVLLSCLLLVSIGLVLGAEVPGSVAFWTQGQNSGEKESVTNTRTLDAAGVSAYLSTRLPSAEAVVVFTTSDGRDPLQHSSVRAAVQGASSTVALANVYSSNSNTKQALLGTKGLESVQKMNLKEFATKIKSADAASWISNSKTEAFEVVLSGHESEQAALLEAQSALSKLAVNNIVYAAIREPTAAAPASDLHYSRVLASSSSSNTDGIYYKPEGTEYAIYYADTYLYLTPDIFTGLLSGIFFLSAVFIGFSCMNQIQGASSFTHKEQMPAIGKEA